MTIDRRLRRAALAGAAFGAWLWGWAELLGRAAVAWRDLALAERIPALASPEAFLRNVFDRFDVPAPVGWGWAVGLIVAGALLGAGASLLVRALRLDPDDLAGETMRWGQGWAAPIAWLVLVLLLVTGAVVVSVPDGVAVVLLVLLLPLFLTVASAVTSPRYAAGVETRWWSPVWRSRAVLASWLLVLAVAALLLFGLAVASEDGGWLRFVLVPLGVWIGLCALALSFHALVERLSPARLGSRARKLLRPAELGPWVVLDFKLIVLFAFLAIPVAAILIFQWKVFPALSQAAAASRREVPLELTWAGNGLDFVRRYAPFLFVPPWMLLFLGQSARLVYRVVSVSFGSRPPGE